MSLCMSGTGYLRRKKMKKGLCWNIPNLDVNKYSLMDLSQGSGLVSFAFTAKQRMEGRWKED